MSTEHEGAVETDKCADCGREMTKEEGGTVFTVCSQCWDKKPLRPAGEMVPFQTFLDDFGALSGREEALIAAHQQAIQGLQAQNHRLMTQLGEEIAESDELVKQRDDLTQQLAEQRVENEKWKTKALDLEGRIANALL